jgi:hypothetical protein
LVATFCRLQGEFSLGCDHSVDRLPRPFAEKTVPARIGNTLGEEIVIRREVVGEDLGVCRFRVARLSDDVRDGVENCDDRLGDQET